MYTFIRANVILIMSMAVVIGLALVVDMDGFTGREKNFIVWPTIALMALAMLNFLTSIAMLTVSKD